MFKKFFNIHFKKNTLKAGATKFIRFVAAVKTETTSFRSCLRPPGDRW